MLGSSSLEDDGEGGDAAESGGDVAGDVYGALGAILGEGEGERDIVEGRLGIGPLVLDGRTLQSSRAVSVRFFEPSYGVPECPRHPARGAETL